ncbi:ElaB/YgaM/YqjD family protein [Azotobacter armeniacus]
MDSNQTPPPSSDHLSCSWEPCASASVHRSNLQRAQQAVIDEFHTLLDDTERLLRHSTEVTSDEADELRAKIESNLDRARETLKDSEARLREQGQAALQATEEYVHSHPWKSLGIAAGVGLLFGLLAGRR